MMIGSIGGGDGGGMSFKQIPDSISAAINENGEGNTISNSINEPQGAEASGGISESITGGGSKLSDDTLAFLLTSGIGEGGGGESDQTGIAETLKLASEAYNAASNLQSNSGSIISGIGGEGGNSGDSGGISGMGGIQA